MKRVICMLLAVFITVSTAMMTYAEEQNKVDLTYYENVVEALDIMHALGLYDEYSTGNLSTDKEIKRGEFAGFISKLIKLSEDNDENKMYYYDVQKNNNNFGAINALTEIGIFNGTGDKLFRPSDVITQEEAVIVMLRVLGYGDYADPNGDFRFGYQSTASNLKLFSGVKSSTNLNMGNMLIMFNNMLEVDMPSRESQTVKYPLTRGGNSTFLKNYHHCYFDESMVVAADNTYIYGESNIRDNEVLMENNMLLSSKLDVGHLLGEQVEYMYIVI